MMTPKLQIVGLQHLRSSIIRNRVRVCLLSSYTSKLFVPKNDFDISSRRNFTISSTLNVPEKPTAISSKNVSEVISKYDTILLDCDGVLWEKDHFTKIKGISQAIDKLKQNKKILKFVTNNSLLTRSSFVEKFKTLAEFEAEIEDVFSVAYAAAFHLKNIVKLKGKCYLIGTQGMADELTQAGIDYIGFGPDNQKVSIRPEDIYNLDYHTDVEAVLVGFDEFFSYQKLTKACSYLTNPKCHYVATNDTEKWIQLNPRWRQPLTGSILPAVSTACNREPLTIGKPHSHLMTLIKAHYPRVNLNRTLMIGDSLRTDITFAKNLGIDSLLVMSGVTNENHLKEQDINNMPTYILDSLANFGYLL